VRDEPGCSECDDYGNPKGGESLADTLTLIHVTSCDIRHDGPSPELNRESVTIPVFLQVSLISD
jgi:hypothetical protein